MKTHPMSRSARTRGLGLAATLLTLAGVPLLPLHATERSWTGGTSTSWDLGANWGGTAPTDSLTADIAAFTQASYANQPTLTTTRSIAGLSFTGTGATTITGTIRIGQSGISKGAGSGASSFVGAQRLSGSQNWTNDSGTALTIGTFGTSSTFGNHSDTSSSTLTLNGSGSGQTIINNIIANVNGTVSMNISRTGSGSVRFTNVNTYTGGTTVSSGALLVNGGSGSSSGTGSGAVSVGTDGRLGGTGRVSGAITLAAGGAMTPGDGGAGTFTGGSSLAWSSNNSTAGMLFDLGASQGSSDQLALTGAFTKGTGSTFIFDFTGSTLDQSIAYTLVTFSSTDFLAGDFSAIGANGVFDLTANSLTFTAIPEPSTFAALAGALVLAGTVWRRRVTARTR